MSAIRHADAPIVRWIGRRSTHAREGGAVALFTCCGRRYAARHDLGVTASAVLRHHRARRQLIADRNQRLLPAVQRAAVSPDLRAGRHDLRHRPQPSEMEGRFAFGLSALTRGALRGVTWLPVRFSTQPFGLRTVVY